MLFYLVWNDRPVRPVYCRGQSTNFCVCNPLCHILCFFIVSAVGVSVWCWFFWRRILMSVPLNILTNCSVSCPKNVNVIHIFCLWVFSLVWSWFVTLFFIYFYEFIWYWFCCNMYFILFCSVFCEFFHGISVESVNQIIDGWHFVIWSDILLCLTSLVYCICCWTCYFVSSVLCTENVFLFCFSIVNCRFGLMLLNSSSIRFMSNFFVVYYVVYISEVPYSFVFVKGVMLCYCVLGIVHKLHIGLRKMRLPLLILLLVRSIHYCIWSYFEIERHVLCFPFLWLCFVVFSGCLI
jgi:hypothetical protein